MTKEKVQAYPLLEPYHYLNVNAPRQVLVIGGVVADVIAGVIAGVVACLGAIFARRLPSIAAALTPVTLPAPVTCSANYPATPIDAR